MNPSNQRSYHIASNPPKSYLVDRRLVDDETGDPLIQLPEDTDEYFRDQFRISNESHCLLYFNFHSGSYFVPGGSSPAETQRFVIIQSTSLTSFRTDSSSKLSIFSLLEIYVKNPARVLIPLIMSQINQPLLSINAHHPFKPAIFVLSIQDIQPIR